MPIPRQRIAFPKLSHSSQSKVLDQLSSILNLNPKDTLLVDSTRNLFYQVLRSLKVKKKILIAAFNFGLMGDILKKAGFDPVYVDVDRNTLNIDASDLKRKISKDIDCAIITHLMGRQVKPEIFSILKKNKMTIIEDCAHCSEFTPQGDVSIFSFNYSKPLANIYGGALSINNPKFGYVLDSVTKAAKSYPSAGFELKMLTKAVIASTLLTPLIFNLFTWPLIKTSNPKNDFLDSKSKDNPFNPTKIRKMGPLAFNVFSATLNQARKRQKKILRLQNTYSQLNNIKELPEPLYYQAIIVKNKVKTKRILRKKGIDCKIEYCKDISGGNCKNASFLQDHLLYLPLYPQLNVKQIKKIVSVLS